MNLTAYSSSESSDEDITTNKDEDFFNLKFITSGGERVEPCPITHKSSLANSSKLIVPNSYQSQSFWSDVTKEENWADEVSIWGVCSHARSNGVPITCKREIETLNMVGYVSKRAKLSHTPSTQPSPLLTNYCKTLSDVKLNTHHFIRPVLNKVAHNYLPNQLMTSMQFSSKPISKIAWCIPYYSHLISSACADGLVRVTDIYTESCPLIIKSHQASVKDATWSPSGQHIASCGFDKTLLITDVESGFQTFSSSHENYLTCVKYHPGDSNLILTGSVDVILGWDVRSPKGLIRKYKFKDRMGQILDICFLSDEEFASSCDFVGRDTADRCILAWDFQTSAPISNEIFHEKYTCPSLARHPFRNEFIAQTQGNYIAQFSSAPPYKMNRHKQYNHHNVSGYGIGCDVNPAGGIVASGSSDGQVVFYNYHTTKVMTKIGDPHVGDVALDVAWHPVLSGTCAYSTWSGRVDIWQKK